MAQLHVYAPEALPEVRAGDSLPDLIIAALQDQPLRSGDLLAISHKIVSKAEGRMYDLREIAPSPEVERYAKLLNKDPGLIQLILSESTEVLWAQAPNRPMICRHRLGYVCANAAVDCSNTSPHHAVALPLDPDRSAAEIRAALETALHIRIGVLICDTHGRAFRNGACGIAVGASGIVALRSYIGEVDRVGRVMQSSVECYADELAAAATLVMGQGDEGRPIAVIRGYSAAIGGQSAREVIRSQESDIFLQALRERSR